MAERISGLSIDLSMDDAGISRSMTNIKNSFRDIKRSAQVNLNNIKFDSKNVDSYKKNIDELSKSFNNQKKNVDDLKSHYDKMVAVHGEGSKEAQAARIEYNKQADELNKLGHALDGATNELKELEEQQRIASSGWTKLGDAANDFGDKLQTIGGGMKDVGKKMTMAVTAPLVGFAGLAVKTGMDFDDAMAQVAAISGATGDDLEALRQKAKDMGATTKFSASEAAEGLNYMALAGWDTEDMLGGLDGVMNLAAASGEDLGTVSDIVTDALSAFGLEAKDSAQFADVLAATSANANTDVVGLGNAFKYVAPVAGALGFTVEDTAKAIGLMSDNGIKGEKAGTALRTMMTNLAKPTKAMQEEMDNLGISLTDTDGNMKTFDEIMNDLRGSFSGLTEEQQASAAATIFGKESMSGALAIINTTEESFDGLGEAINSSEGEAQRMAETMEDNLGGTWREIKSGIEAFSISIYEAMLPALSKMSDKILEGIQWLNSLSPKVKTLGVIFGAVAAAIGPLLVVGGSFLMFLGGVFRAITPVTAAIAKAGGLIKWLAPLFGALTSPVTLTVAAIAALGAGFVIAYKKSETFRNFIDGLKDKFLTAWGSVVEFKDNFLTAFDAIFALFKGDNSGIDMLKSLGLNEEQVTIISDAVEKIKEVFGILKDKVTGVLSEIGEFFKSSFGDIKSWWDSDGALIFEAMGTVVSKVFDFIKFAVDTGLKFVVDLFNRFAPIIEGIWNILWPTIQFLVENVWEKIKLVIGVAMDLIQGIISGVSALIEGDWKRFGEILKETALSIKDRVTEFFGNMKENALRLFGELFSGAKQWFSDMWSNLTNKARDIKTGVINRFNELKDGAINKVRDAYNSVTSWFQDMWSNVTTKARNIKNDVVNRFNELKNNTVQKIRETYNSITKWFSDMWNKVTTTVTNLKNDVVNYFVNMKDGAIDGVQKLYDGASNLFDDVKTYASDTFQNMVDGAKQLPGKIGDAIKNGASKAVDGIKSLGNKMTEKLGAVVNGVIGGLNSVTAKIGIDTKIEKWSVPTFSTGTGQGSPSGKLTKNGKIAMDTLATVGDKGKGNGKGTRELVHYPNGKVGLYDNDATIFAPKGTTIFSNQETEAMLGQLPKFSEGTGLWGKIKSIAGKAVDYITNPKKIFDDLINAVGEKFDGMSGFALNMVKGAWNTIKDGMFGWIKDKFSEATVGKSQKWMDYKMTTPYSPNKPVPGYPRSFNNGHHYGIDYGTPVGVNITAPMAGTVSKINDRGGGNVARLKAGGNAAQYFMHMSSVKTGKVGIGESVGKSGNSGEFTTGAHVHWQHEDPAASYVQNRFTKNPLSMIKGHLKGGQILSDGLFNLHKGEYVINPNEPTEAMKLLAIVGKKLAGKSKQTREIASVPGTTGNDELLDKMQQQIDLLTQLVMSSKAIEKKELKVGDNQIGQANDRYNARQSSRQSVKTGRISYV